MGCLLPLESVYVSDYSVCANDNIFELSSSIFSCTGHINQETKDVFDALIGLDTKKGIGPGKVSPLLLQKWAECLTKPCAIIFNKSLTLCVFF